MHCVPLGYYRSESVESTVDFLSREIDVFFAGTIESAKRGIRKIGTPKTISRSQMLQACRDASLKGFRLLVGETPTAFEDSPGFGNYLENLARAKICLCPRGNSPESYRYYEAFRAGCIVLTDEVLELDFHRGAPYVLIREWSDLPKVVTELLSDPPRLVELNRKTREWWQSYYSEEAVAQAMVKKIRLS